MKLKLLFTLCLVFILNTNNANADFSTYLDDLKSDVKQTWNDGKLGVYVPLRVWHNRLTYDKEHIDKYNEEPWGFGLGLSRKDGYDWHGLYAMGFKDSNSYLETFIGYAFLRNNKFTENNDDWLWGYGYTIGVTQRHEYSYIPIPLPLPILGLTYKNISLNATYVPGIKNDGNVLFTWLKYDF